MWERGSTFFAEARKRPTPRQSKQQEFFGWVRAFDGTRLCLRKILSYSIMSIRELETRLNETRERSRQLFQQMMAIMRQQISRELFPPDVNDRISELMDQRRVLTEEAAGITTQLNGLRSRPRSRSRSRTRSRSRSRSRHENSRPDAQASAQASAQAAQAGLPVRQVPQAAQERMRAAQERTRSRYRSNPRSNQIGGRKTRRRL